MSTQRITVIGGGTMGNGITHVCAQAGLSVRLVDVSRQVLGTALRSIDRRLERMVEKGVLEPAVRTAALERIETATDVEPAVADADLVIEAVPERAELKRDVFSAVDRAAPASAVLASNTSSISITEIGSWTSRPDRVIGMHFMNPVHVMRLVEVIRGLETSDETTGVVTELTRVLGKTPVEVNDSPGFVSNRVLMPMINEAVFALMEGVAEPDAIDTVFKLGMHHPMGPLELADLIGLDTCLSILEVLHRDLGDDRYRPCPLLRKYVAARWLGRKSGRGFHSYPEAARAEGG